MGNNGRAVLYFGNKTGAALTGVTALIKNGPELEVNINTPIKNSVIGASVQSQMPFTICCKAEFAEPPKLDFQYSPANSAPIHHVIDLPIVLSKFLNAPPQKQIAAPEFMQTWKALSAPELEVQKVFKARSRIHVSRVRQLMTDGFKVVCIDRVDPKDTNLVLSAILRTENTYNVLVRLETNAEAGMYRITVHSDTAKASQILAQLFIDQLSEL